MDIPTFIIQNPNRPQQSQQVHSELSRSSCFNIHLVNQNEDDLIQLRQLECFKSIITNLVRPDYEFILICSDEHQFTPEYSTSVLQTQILEAKTYGADVLAGGVAGFDNALHVSDNIVWTNSFTGAQFIIIFKKFFHILQTAPYSPADSVETLMARISEKLYFVHPFISVQTTTEHIGNQFHRSDEAIRTIHNIRIHYARTDMARPEADLPPDTHSLTLPCYIFNLPERTDRKAHILSQFEGRNEFDITLLQACRHPIGAVGLWQSIRKAISIAESNMEDVVVLCEDDHTFTKDYDKHAFLKNIIAAHEQGVDMLSGGTSWFRHAIPAGPGRYWVHPCSATQFIVIYRKFFRSILDAPFDDTVTADTLLSDMTPHKMVIYPFISVQHDFGYSDVTPAHNIDKDLVGNMFRNSQHKLMALNREFWSSQCYSKHQAT